MRLHVTGNRDEISSRDETRPGMKKYLFAREFHPVEFTRVEFHPGMKFILKENIPFRSSHQRCSIKKGAPNISQNSQENTCIRVSFFNKVAVLTPATLLKKRLWHMCFPVNFAKSLGTPFFIEHLWWLLLI